MNDNTCQTCKYYYQHYVKRGKIATCLLKRDTVRIPA